MVIRRVNILMCLLVLCLPFMNFGEHFIVYTAHQDWPSRIYIMNMNGVVQDYFEYSFYRFVDLEVVNNEVYVAEAFAPRVYKVNLTNGDLQVVIDDWSLLYFYDLAWDGTFFYLDEWDLNRYDINGNKDGTASFDETVFGSAWDGNFYWILDDDNQIRCWDITEWPTLCELPGNACTPPDTACRGLWFDGEDFWTAQSLDGVLGNIYKFDDTGAIADQWAEPAFRGWAAGVVEMLGVREQQYTAPEQHLVLHPPEPNPFRHKTKIRFTIQESRYTIQKAKVSIYDASGRMVKHFDQESSIENLESEVVWNGQDASGYIVPAGVYIVRLEVGDGVRTRKILRVE
jgi:hypothetical protein